jgi:acetyl-CoA synthetase
MPRQFIHKQAELDGVAPNLADYEACRSAFSWDAARAELDGLPGGGLNIAHEAVDRHASGALAEKTAVRWIARDGGLRDVSYAELARRSNRFANALQALGLKKGDRVFALLGRIPELYVSALGTWKAGCVLSPLFSAFGPEPIQTRMEIGGAKALVTTTALYQRKVSQIRDSLPGLEHVIVVGPEGDDETLPGTHDFADLTAAADDRFTIAPTDPEDMALLHFTSGTTGRPKGAIHVHDAIVTHHVTAKFALDLHRDDIYWCTADPGWVTGTSYGIIAPLSIGATMIVDEEEFDAERWYRILEEQAVTVWYTAPTAIRMLMKAGVAVAQARRYPTLRFLASVGEPLNPEAVLWSQEALGRPFHDNWWQTETGGIMIANFASMDIKPGSMGKPLPGIEASLVRRAGKGRVEVIDGPDETGELALRPGWPSMFRGYLNEEERYRKCFAGGWYLTGDLASRDADGYYWFVGRADDVIKSAGHLIGPFEVECVLMEHPAVAEAGVIGKPDPVAMETVKAFVALKAGFTPGEALRKELMAHARRRLGAAVAPREIDFCANLPKTRSGKIMRRLLKARELGLPEGDLSTLESG